MLAFISCGRGILLVWSSRSSIAVVTLSEFGLAVVTFVSCGGCVISVLYFDCVSVVICYWAKKEKAGILKNVTSIHVVLTVDFSPMSTEELERQGSGEVGSSAFGQGVLQSLPKEGSLGF
ncbi:hypothetical protein ACSQ67_026370 [Phaseolus vulgaris]